jgi:hypothetical protein
MELAMAGAGGVACDGFDGTIGTAVASVSWLAVAGTSSAVRRALRSTGRA